MIFDDIEINAFKIALYDHRLKAFSLLDLGTGIWKIELRLNLKYN
jgi:hypothetical protein